MRLKNLTPLFVSFVVALSLAACGVEEEKAELEQQEQSVIGGVPESGYPAVGALTYDIPDHGYFGSFCTAALIDEEWVLTASHCLVEGGDVMNPAWISFHNGPDARPVSGERPPGEYFGFDAVYVHPNYDDANYFDIALLHLAEPVTHITPYEINRETFETLGVDQTTELFYVGYGIDDDANNSGGGVKRSAWVPYDRHVDGFYFSEFQSTGVCFGDSGGPGLLDVDGTFVVAGVNNFVSGPDASPCHGEMGFARVDAHLYWLESVMSGTPIDCNEIAGVCRCGDACLEDGTCDNTLCTPMTCNEVYECLEACEDDVCRQDCEDQSTPEAIAMAAEVTQCEIDECADSEDRYCTSEKCTDQIAACWGYEQVMTCAESTQCYFSCRDRDCRTACYFGVQKDDQEVFNEFLSCVQNMCYWARTNEEFMRCIGNSCGESFDTCYAREACDLTGGSCGEEGDACGFFSVDEPRCWYSKGLSVGSLCDLEADYPLECEDGAVCLSSGALAACHELCYLDEDCPERYECVTGFEELDPALGVCAPCTDADKDGVCEKNDCDDQDATAFPGGLEICDDIDNDCNGEIDEGCYLCIDRDDDGVCEEFDCDDNDPELSPRAQEVCGDGVDNDCDEEIDEGCAHCVDKDGDGACASIDCDDNDPALTPAAVEHCGDHIDNNCNGSIDENCVVEDTTVSGGGGCSVVGASQDSQRGPLSLLALVGLFLVARRVRR